MLREVLSLTYISIREKERREKEKEAEIKRKRKEKNYHKANIDRNSRMKCIKL